MLSKILEDSFDTPKTVGYKITKELLTLSDEEEACTRFKWAYEFALKIPGANIEKCCESACKDPEYAYRFALYIPGADIEKCCEAACKGSYYAYLFALTIPGADIEKCQEGTCKDPGYAYMFAKNIPGVNIEKCQEREQNMLSKIREGAVIVPKTFGYKLENRSATLADEEGACNNSWWAHNLLYIFLGLILGTPRSSM